MAEPLDLDDVAARALTSVILERTADVLRDGGQHAAAALAALEADSGLVPDVCAAILQATSWLAGAGGIDAAAAFAASVAFSPEPDELDPAEGAELDPTDNLPDELAGDLPHGSPEPSQGAVAGSGATDPPEPAADAPAATERAMAGDEGDEGDDLAARAQEATRRALEQLAADEANGSGDG